jgi:hypothetical protein
MDLYDFICHHILIEDIGGIVFDYLPDYMQCRGYDIDANFTESFLIDFEYQQDLI